MTPATMASVINSIKYGRFIEACQQFRAIYSIDLEGAKEACHEIRYALGIATPAEKRATDIANVIHFVTYKLNQFQSDYCVEQYICKSDAMTYAEDLASKDYDVVIVSRAVAIAEPPVTRRVMKEVP